MVEETRGSLLVVDGLVTGYGMKQVLNGVSLDIASGEVVAIVGHNGAGKSTLLKTVFGVLPIWSGRVVLDGALLGLPNPRKLLCAGVAYVPQGNRVFAGLTVWENLKMGGVCLPNGPRLRAAIERVFAFLPALKPRLGQRAGTLSGGEKQMLALGMRLLTSPRLLLLDEPSLGLAPPLVTEALRGIQQISRDSGTSVVIVEQKVREVLNIARRVYVLRNGQVSFSGLTESLRDDAKLREVYL